MENFARFVIISSIKVETKEVDKEAEARELFLKKRISQSIDDKADFVKEFLECSKASNSLPQPEEVKKQKSVQKSHLARSIGHRKFIENNFLEALEAYNESICWAPTGSESLAAAYAHRSSVYWKCGFFKFCLESIDLALENDCPDTAKVKLNERKEACLEKMKIVKDSAEICDYMDLTELSYPANPKIPFMINDLKIQKNSRYGRHVVTTRDLKVGEIISMEEPAVKTIALTGNYTNCFYCCKNEFYNLKPCPKSTRIMFCSEKCSENAWNGFYKYFCPIIDGIMDTKVYLMLSLRAVLDAFINIDDPMKLKKLIGKGCLEPFDVDYTQADEISKFQAMLSLSTNESMDCQTLYNHYESITHIFHMLKEYTDFKHILKTQKLENLFLKLFVRIVFIFKVNACGFHDKPEDLNTISEKVNGVFLTGSMYNHSCMPNLNRLSANGTNYLIVQRPIKAGEQLFDCYGPYVRNAKVGERKRILKNLYQFDCYCDGCRLKTIPQSPNIKFKASEELIKFFPYARDVKNPYDQSTLRICQKAKEEIVRLLTEGTSEITIDHLDLCEYLDFCFKVEILKKPLKSMFELRM